MSQLLNKTDLTRWNRAGLSRFRYVDGNAISFLEALRQAMQQQFGATNWQALDLDIPANESPAQRQARWEQLYRQQRQDHGWEILRSYARSLHVLGEYLDAYANESCIGTATQWPNVRRLVEMLNYQPAPPASAQTYMALLSKAGRSGNVEKGLALSNTPQDGSAPSLFETLEDLDVDAALNQLRAAEWDKSQQLLNFAALSGGAYQAQLPLDDTAELSVGEAALLQIENAGATQALAGKLVQVGNNEVRLQAAISPSGEVRLHQVSLKTGASFKQKPLLRGSNVAQLSTREHGLGEGDVVAWQDSGGHWQAARITDTVRERIQFAGLLPQEGAYLYAVGKVDAVNLSGVSSPTRRTILPSSKKTDRLWNHSLSVINSSALSDEPVRLADGSDAGSTLYQYLNGYSYPAIYYVVNAAAIARVDEFDPQALEFAGEPSQFNSGDWLLVQSEGELTAAKVTAINSGADSYRLSLSQIFNQVDLVIADFAASHRPTGHNQNLTPIFLTDPLLRSDSYSTVPLAQIPESLDVGRSVIVAGKDDAMLAQVIAVDDATQQIRLTPPIPGSERSADGTTDSYSRYHTILYANVALCGHGETQPTQTLGSGDAAQSNQTFKLDVDNVSFVADSHFARGVRADLAVQVDGRLWQQVASLSDARAEDSHYSVSMNEDGTLLLQFGDGVRGRRLPSGDNNVRVSYRTGNGLVGNLAALQLDTLPKPHALLGDILQLLPAVGGNDMETAAAMRSAAPASVLTLARAVSLTDFTHLAASNSRVWQARAFRRQPGMARDEHIEVAIVPSGGGPLGSLADELADNLLVHSLPGVKITISPYQALVFSLVVRIAVDTQAFNPDQVAATVAEQLWHDFALQQRRLGEALYRSQVVAAVEGVLGVANCHCQIQAEFSDQSGAPVTPSSIAVSTNGAVKRVSALPQQVLYLDPELSLLTITTEALEV